MTHVFAKQADDFYTAYPSILHDVIEWGTPVDSRGGMTREIENYAVSVAAPRMIVPKREGLSSLLGWMEGAQLLGSIATPDLMDECWPKMKSFTDHYGDYGARASTSNQLGKIFTLLQRDPETRQAVITLWDPWKDAGETDHSDHPCTVSIGFRVRAGKLNMTVTMRSNDVWLGASSDFTQFSLLLITFADALGLGVGTYTHFAYSMHLYERDLEKAENFLNAPFERFGEPSVLPMARIGWSYMDIQSEARKALLGTGTPLTVAGRQLRENIAKRQDAVR